MARKPALMDTSIIYCSDWYCPLTYVDLGMFPGDINGPGASLKSIMSRKGGEHDAGTGRGGKQ